MKTLRAGIIIGAVLLSFTSCKKGGLFCYKGDGNIVTEVRDHDGFKNISLEMGGTIYLEQGKDYDVQIEASENLMEIIETEVSGSTLEIDLKKGTCLKNSGEIKIYITTPDIQDISISGSGDVYARNLLAVDDLDISISGSGNFELDSLDIDNLDVSISGSGDLYLNSIDTVNTQKIRISGSGDINSFNMPVLKSDISISGSGDCEVHVVNELEVNISGSGDVVYKGHPLVYQNISGSGSVKPN